MFCTNSPWCESDEVCRCEAWLEHKENMINKNKLKMIGKIFAFIIVIAFIILINVFSIKRDKALMSLCADHTTQTLYECE